MLVSRCCKMRMRLRPKMKRYNITSAVIAFVFLFISASAILKLQSYTFSSSRQNHDSPLHRAHSIRHISESNSEMESNPWEHHPKNSFLERANALVKTGILIVNKQFPSLQQYEENVKPSVEETKISISKFIIDEIPSFPRESSESRDQYSSWPECLCGTSVSNVGKECSPLQSPDDAVKMETEAGGSCSWRAWRESTNKIISVSLFGPHSNYKTNLISLINGSTKSYPGWSIWVYTRHPNPREMCPQLKSAPHVFYCDTRALPALGDLKRTTPLVWKISPLGDPRVQALFVRNLNKSPLEREASAIQDWLSSDKQWHVMRDHPRHTLKVEPGMWSVRWDVRDRLHLASLRNVLITRSPTAFTTKETNNFLSANNTFDMFSSSDKLWVSYRGDQHEAKGAIWPHMVRSNSVLSHDSYRCNDTAHTAQAPWPSRRFGNSFVGMGAQVEILPDCPVHCRPSLHKEWTSC